MKEHPGILLRRRNAPAKLKLPSFNWKERSAQLTLAAMIAAGSVAGLVSAVWPSTVLPDTAQPAAPARVHDDMQSKLPESAPVSAPAPAAQSQTHTHIVLAGETLSGIAAKYNVDVATLLSANPQAGEMIYPGDQLIVLPERGVLHVVEAGDTLWGLANQYNVTTEAIMNANKRHDDRLAIGEKLIIPGGRHRAAYTASRAIQARFIWPTSGEFTSPYGYRWGRIHAGIDVANDPATPVRAARAGRIVYAGWQSGYGNTVVIDHGSDYSTLYAHLHSFAVAVGNYVQTGQFIAYMGNTGNSTGTHLHFEIRVGDKPVNPMNYLN